MKQVIDNYLNFIKEREFSKELDIVNYKILSDDGFITFKINQKNDKANINIKGNITPVYASISIIESTPIENDKEFCTKTLTEFIKKDNSIVYEKRMEERTNLYDYEDVLIRSKLERDSKEMIYFDLKEKDKDKDLLDNIDLNIENHILIK